MIKYPRLGKGFSLAVLGALLFAQPDYSLAADAEYDLTDSSLVLKQGTLSLDQIQYYGLNKIQIDNGATLILPEHNYYSLGVNQNAELINNGTIEIHGEFDIEPNNVSIEGNGIFDIIPSENNMGSRLFLGVDELTKILDNQGKIIIGIDDYGEKPNNRDNSAHVQLQYPDGTVLPPLTLRADQFTNRDTTDSQSAGTILLKEWGAVMTGTSPLTITGDKLQLGILKFSINEMQQAPDKDIKESRLSRLRGGNITLAPSTENTVTLSAGVLHIGRGSAPGDAAVTAQKSSLKIGSDGKGILQLDGGALALGGAGNTDHGQGTIEGNIIIGTANGQDIDSAMIARTGDWTMRGDLTLEKSGYLEVGRPYFSDTLDRQEIPATLNVEGVLALKTQFYLNDANLRAKEIKADPDSVIEVSGSAISVNKLNMAGGKINFDPAFIADGNTSNASMGGLNFDSNNVDARINIGRNSMVTLGSDDPEWLRSRIIEYQTKNSLLWGRDITAALAIRSPQVLSSNGGLNVDGTWTSGGTPATANVARFADKSLFVIDGSNLKNQTALDGNGTASLQVETGAKLLITDVATGDVIKITDNFGSSEVSDAGWTAKTAASTDVQNVESELVNPATGEYVVRVTEGKNSVDVFPALAPELAAVIDAAREKGLNTNANTAGRRFIARAVDNRFIGSTNAELAAATIESAARIAVVGAVPQMAKAANDAAGAAITQRTSLAQPEGALQAVDQNGAAIQDNGLHANSFALWIMPLYQSTNGFGMEAGNFDYDFNGALGGVALGADYTFENMLRLGVSFNIGGGYARGTGDLNKTTNNMNFWGIGAYAGWTKNNFGLSADISYTSTYNKLKQELPAQMEMSDLKGDISAWAISTGLRAEYKFETSYLDIIPHAGFRFMNLNTDSYDVKSNGSTVLNGDSFTQNIWTFPLGVSLTKNYQLENGWKVKPLLDLNVTPATGDIKVKTNIRFSGIGQGAELETKMMDYVTYGGTAGIEFGNDTVSFGVSYNGQFGAESSAQGIFGTFRYEF